MENFYKTSFRRIYHEEYTPSLYRLFSGITLNQSMIFTVIYEKNHYMKG